MSHLYTCTCLSSICALFASLPMFSRIFSWLREELGVGGMDRLYKCLWPVVWSGINRYGRKIRRTLRFSSLCLEGEIGPLKSHISAGILYNTSLGRFCNVCDLRLCGNLIRWCSTCFGVLPFLQVSGWIVETVLSLILIPLIFIKTRGPIQFFFFCWSEFG